MKKCSVAGCGNRHYAKGLCGKHYQRVAATGSTEIREWRKTCKADGCSLMVHAQGLCSKHYTRKIRHGDAEFSLIVVGDAKERLSANSVKTESGCWEWARFKKNGYGVTSINGRLEQAHRASWKVFVGEIPEGMQINHKCHNRACINPNHLYVGDQKQNMEDMYASMRNNNARGESVGNAVLDGERVRKIKARLANGEECAAIAREIGVAPTTISSIKTGRTWRHVEI